MTQEAKAQGGRSRFHHSVLADNVECVRELLRRGTFELDLSIKDPDLTLGERSETPLLSAMAFASKGVVELLLDARANVCMYPSAQTR